MKKPEKLLSVIEFSLKVNRAPATIYRMVETGKLKSIKVAKGNRVVNKIPIREMEKFE